MIVPELKKYLISLGIYGGPLTDTQDESFIFALKSLENKIPNSVGLICSGNKLNPFRSVADIKAAVSLLKIGQAKLDAIDLKDPPSSTKFVPTADDMNGDPSNSQQIGLAQTILPKKMHMDDRIIELLKMK